MHHANYHHCMPSMSVCVRLTQSSQQFAYEAAQLALEISLLLVTLVTIYMESCELREFTIKSNFEKVLVLAEFICTILTLIADVLLIVEKSFNLHSSLSFQSRTRKFVIEDKETHQNVITPILIGLLLCPCFGLVALTNGKFECGSCHLVCRKVIFFSAFTIKSMAAFTVLKYYCDY